MRGEEAHPIAMTIVVPVFNAARFIERCVVSFDAQECAQEDLEVIFINDGSTDGSHSLCSGLVASRSNYVLIDQENRGVSAARNRGIRAARGRYIMFVDADDEISAKTVSSLVKAFDEFGHSVDLITYPLTYREAQGGYDHRHRRQEWLRNTGVYSLQDYPFIVQTTTNVCVRNDGPDTPLFDESRSLCEDQRFNTDILSKKACIGYCADAEYIYWRHSSETASLRGLTPSTFDGIAGNYEHYEQLAREHPAFSRYAYALTLYEVAWRFRQRRLLPDTDDDGYLASCEERVDGILRAIPFENWAESPYLSDTLRVFLMERCGLLGMIERISYPSHGTEIVSSEGTLILSPPRVVLDWALRKEDCLRVKGFVYGPSFRFEEQPALWVRIGDDVKDLKASPSHCDDEKTGTSITRSWRFSVDLPAMGKRPYDVQFGLSIRGRDVPFVDVALDLERCNGWRPYQNVREFGGWRITANGTVLHVGTIKDLPRPLMPFVTAALRVRNRVPEGSVDVGLVKELRRKLPASLRQDRKRKVWLYIDAVDDRHETLALRRLKSDVGSSTDGIERLYVLLHNGEYRCIPEAKGITVLQSPYDHLVQMLSAERVITSTDSFRDIVPYNKEVWDRVADFVVDQTYVLVADSYQHIGDSMIDIVVSTDAQIGE